MMFSRQYTAPLIVLYGKVLLGSDKVRNRRNRRNQNIFIMAESFFIFIFHAILHIINIRSEAETESL